MKKAIILIALIAIAACGNQFLGNLRDNYEKAKAEFEAQYKAQLKLQEQAEDLAAQAAAAAGGVDPEAVVSTINGLTEAAKFWGGFVGNEMFNKEELSQKIGELKEKRAQLQKYASTDGQEAMVALNQAVWDISVCIKSIQSLAVQLKKGAKNVMMITSIAFKAKQDMLEGRNKMIYQAAIKVLVNTLKSGNSNAAQIQEKLYNLSTQLITIETKMKATADALQETAKGKSREFNDWKKDMRAKVYGGCAAGIIFPPAAAACYAIGAGILETEIKKYQRETEAFVRDFNSWAETFTGMSTMARQASTVSKNWYNKVTDFKNVIQNQYDLIQGTQDILWMSHDMRQMVSDELVTLIAECDKVINDTTGRLQGDDEEALMAEFPKTEQSPEFDDLTEEQVAEQVTKICKRMNPSNKKSEMECFEKTLARISSQ